MEKSKWPLIMALVSSLSILIGMRLQESLTHDGYLARQTLETNSEKAIYEAAEHIQHKFYGELDKESMTDATIHTMIDELDPYSHYFEADRAESYDRYINGLYSGVGLEFATYEDTVFVFRVLPSSPADRSSIRQGSIVSAIDSLSLTDSSMDLDSFTRSIARKIGDLVTITVQDQQTGLETRHELTVEDVPIPLIDFYVVASKEDSGTTGYIRIKRFYTNVYRDFMDILDQQKILGTPVSHLIIDLRNNPGGIVEETIKLLNQLIPEKNQLILSTVTNSGRTKTYKSNGRTFLDLERIVIITNEQSASASEILAGTLQDYDKAVLIGQTTYGKGLIQQNYDLSNGGSINLSIGEYILPSGRHIYNGGRNDTLYTTIVNKRSISAAEGIPPDVRIKSCATGYVSADDIKNYSLKYKIFNNSEIPEHIRNNVFQINQSLESESCQGLISQAIIWKMNEAIKNNGDKINSEDGDQEIQRAIDIIGSDEYLELLGY